MNGRVENDEKLKVLIEKNLIGKPKFLKEYYETLWKKTYPTKKQYLNNIYNFLNYITEHTTLNGNHVEDVCRIKPRMIDAYLGSLNIKNNTKASVYYAINSLFEFLEKDERISVNPCRKVDIPKDNEIHEITYLTSDEIQTMLNNVLEGVGSELAKKRQLPFKKRDYLLLTLALSTGMRISSILQININDVNYVDKYIDIHQKGNKEQHVPISDNIISLIDEWEEDREKIIINSSNSSNALFISANGLRMTAKSAEKLVTKYSYNIDKHITPHKLRSTCATQLIKNTGNIYLVSHILGHSSVETTKRYAAVDKEMEEQAVEVMDSILF